jgi:hypothetical protein
MNKWLLLAVVVACVANAGGSPDHGAVNQKQEITRQAPPEPVRVPVSPEWALVIVGIITFVVIGWQSWETRRSAQAMRDGLPLQKSTADAALLSARAVVNAERAWIVAELNCICNQGKDGRWYQRDGTALTMEEALRGDHLRYELKLTNAGRTPANITSFQVSYTLLPKGVTDLPTNAGGDLSERREPNQFVAGSSSVEISEPIIAVDAYTRGHWLPIRALEETAVVHGWVKYRHMFDQNEDQADFCYVYSVKLNRLSSVARYTNYTQGHPGRCF